MAVPVMPLFRCDRGHRGFAEEIPESCPCFELGRECGAACRRTTAAAQGYPVREKART